MADPQHPDYSMYSTGLQRELDEYLQLLRDHDHEEARKKLAEVRRRLNGIESCLERMRRGGSNLRPSKDNGLLAGIVVGRSR